MACRAIKLNIQEEDKKNYIICMMRHNKKIFPLDFNKIHFLCVFISFLLFIACMNELQKHLL